MYTICGDLHAKPDNLDKVNTLFDILEDLGNPVIFLGDTLDTKEVIRGRCLNTIYERVSNSKLNFIFLIGNHCWFNLQCEQHSLEVLKSLPNVTIVDKPQTIEGIRFYPYLPADKIKADLENTKTSVIIGHFDIKSFDYGNGIISTEGLEVSDFKNFKRVISGHYHKYQEAGNITYPGTPFSHSFGESNQQKYISIYNAVTDKLELLDTPFPRHITLEVDCSKQKALQENAYDNLRVILKGSQEEIDRFTQVEGVKYIEQPTTLVKSAMINETETPEVQFSRWGTDIKAFSPELVEKGLKILKAVKTGEKTNV